MGFTPTPGIPVLVVDTDGKTVGGGGLDQAGKPTTSNNNGQNAEFVPMQMCTCSAGVKNATHAGSGKIRLRGGNNSGMLALPFLLSMGACPSTVYKAKLIRLLVSRSTCSFCSPVLLLLLLLLLLFVMD